MAKDNRSRNRNNNKRFTEKQRNEVSSSSSRFSCLKSDIICGNKNSSENCVGQNKSISNREYKNKDKKSKKEWIIVGGKDESGGKEIVEETEGKEIVEKEEKEIITFSYLTVAKKVICNKGKDISNEKKDNYEENVETQESEFEKYNNGEKDIRKGLGYKIGNKVYDAIIYEKYLEEQSKVEKVEDKFYIKRQIDKLVKKWDKDRKFYIDLYGYDNYEHVFKFKNYDYHYFDKLDHQYKVNNYYTMDNDSSYSSDNDNWY
jgi:hypothetical protein